jgi:hypothetical protein
VILCDLESLPQTQIIAKEQERRCDKTKWLVRSRFKPFSTDGKIGKSGAKDQNCTTSGPSFQHPVLRQKAIMAIILVRCWGVVGLNTCMMSISAKQLGYTVVQASSIVHFSRNPYQ